MHQDITNCSLLVKVLVMPIDISFNRFLTDTMKH